MLSNITDEIKSKNLFHPVISYFNSAAFEASEVEV
jgi:hypothetical protein